ncbi:MAG: hypothetical protein ACLRU1_03415 [Veillonella parvula]
MYHQVVLTFNPWSDRHWLKKRFLMNPVKCIGHDYELPV